jgi:hypothetical protein
MSSRGRWIVCLVEGASGENQYIGPFTSEARANHVRDRLNADFLARRAEDVYFACVEWVRPGAEIEEVRDELLAELEENPVTS